MEISTRERIIQAADQLFYQQGFGHTSFTAIADAVSLSRGNFYYHFRTKDDILQAVIQYRLQNTEAMLKQWEKEGQSPRERLMLFANMLLTNKEYIKQSGCPVGTLTSELAKLNHTASRDANVLFTLFRQWLKHQFTQAGKKDADQLAMHLLARSQGVATLTNAFKNEAFIKREVQSMRDWLNAVLSTD